MNCIHALPRVRELHNRHPEVLVPVGVHAGKYPTERRTYKIRRACDRMGITHLVANDRHFRTWRAYNVQAWPTMGLVAPDGSLLGTQSGEFTVEQYDGMLGRMIESFDQGGQFDRTVKEFGRDPEAPPPPSGALRYPTRVIGRGDLLYVSDTGHDRVLELRLTAEDGAVLLRSWGGDRPGFVDGPEQDACLREPQGLALHQDALIVADRGNHALRRIDLDGGETSTVAGTGALGAWGVRPGPARMTDLRSPWDVVVREDTLVIAMAGSHQLWWADLTEPEVRLRLLAGSGGENIVDGRQDRALLAQPMGLASDGERVYFADAESSAVRSASLMPDGEVRTIVGRGLFEHGDKDGSREEALLQHPQSLAFVDAGLLVADSYNDKLKWVEPRTGQTESLPGAAGSGEALDEPCGVWAGEAGVFVADTNNHRLVRVDAATGSVSPLEIRTTVGVKT